ncbi:endothelin-converting enzyme 1-like isoform X2 [Lineus longissimus]|uniref:endothelin-converting enzyme 1-like isoform X2 n=1 Tax=Lineus longissimus TaxID=88925 RepID=UPI002B4CD509
MGRAVSIVLGVICVILLIVCVILGVLFATAVTSKGEGCSTPQCLSDARHIKALLNTSVDPCENFYDFACGNFAAAKLVDYFDEVGNEVLEMVRRGLEKPIENDAKNSTERKMKEFYASCLESDVKEKQKMATVREMVKKIGGFDSSTPSDEINLYEFNPVYFDFDDALQYVQFNLSTDATLSVSVKLEPNTETDRLESFISIASKYQFLCTILDGDFYNDTKAHAQRMSECFGGKSQSGKSQFANDVVEVIMYYCKKDDTESIANFTTKRMTWNELMTDQPWLKNSKIDWSSLFEKPFREWNHQPFEISESGVWMMKQLSDIYENLNVRKFRNYLIYVFLDESRRGMPKCIDDAEYGKSTPVRDPMEGTTIWKRCIMEKVNPTFSLGILAMLEKQMDHPIVTDEKLRKIVEEIRAVILKRITALPWLDDYLKERIKKRVEDKVVMLGGPRRVLDDDFVDRFFKNLHINKSLPYLVNDINAKKFQRLMQAIALRSPNIHYHLYIKSTDAMFVNAMNEVYLGGLVMFWSILRSPFYNYHSQEYLQYGSIGGIIGHEFGHDFDGVHTYETWANQTEVPELVKSESCLQDYYRNINYTGWEPPPQDQGVAMSNQGIPDVVGVKWAIEAYRKHVADRGREDDILAGLPYTQEQLFLISKTQLWCNNGEAFMTIRMLGSEGLNPYFPEIFNCPKDAPMNPENKCNLW